ncbi:MAG: hypothetical protein AB7E55_18755 [Pigmentiphaga sp.]
MTLVRPRKAGSAHAAIGRMIDAIGAQDVADSVEVSKFTVYKWADPEQPGDLAFHRACQISAHFRTTILAEHLALRAGGVFVPLPDIDADGEWGVLTAETAGAFADAMREVAQVLCPKSDGGRGVTPREAARLVSTIDEGLATLARLRGMALAAAGDEA